MKTMKIDGVEGMFFSERELEIALSNIGFDITCGACAEVFFTGSSSVIRHDNSTCKTNRINKDTFFPSRIS